jgi:hypothetical protein
VYSSSTAVVTTGGKTTKAAIAAFVALRVFYILKREMSKCMSKFGTISLAVIFILLIAGLLSFFNFENNNSSLFKKSTTPTKVIDRQRSTLAVAASKLTEESSSESTQSQVPINDEALRSAWEFNHNLAPALPLPQDIDIYEVASLDMESPDYPRPGEYLELQLPQGYNYRVLVNSGHVSPKGDYSWRGYIEGYGDHYPVIMTYGQRSIFATITSPQGSYSLEALDGVGWLYKNPAPEQLTAPGLSDSLEIPEPGSSSHRH